MKEFNKVVLHLLFWIIIPVLILYFKWVGQDTTTLPGLPVPESESYFEIVGNNIDVIFVSLLSSIPVFYWSLFCLTPKLLFKVNFIKILLYTTSLIVYFFIVSFVTEIISPMYFFFGIPYAIKVLEPIVLISGLGGTLFAFIEKRQKEKFIKMISAKV